MLWKFIHLINYVCPYHLIYLLEKLFFACCSSQCFFPSKSYQSFNAQIRILFSMSGILNPCHIYTHPTLHTYITHTYISYHTYPTCRHVHATNMSHTLHTHHTALTYNMYPLIHTIHACKNHIYIPEYFTCIHHGIAYKTTSHIYLLSTYHIHSYTYRPSVFRCLILHKISNVYIQYMYICTMGNIFPKKRSITFIGFSKRGSCLNSSKWNHLFPLNYPTTLCSSHAIYSYLILLLDYKPVEYRLHVWLTLDSCKGLIL